MRGRGYCPARRAAGAAAAWGEADWFVGVPDMTALARSLLAGLDVRTGCLVAGLARDRAGWRLLDQDGASIASGFGAVLVTIPAPQARRLFATADGAEGFEAAPLDARLARVRYAPCWALLLAYRGEPAFSEPYRRERDPAAALAWIARDATKPGRGGGGETLVVHAGPDWSREHLERGPDEAAGLLEEALRGRHALPDRAAFAYAAAHRWRYAQVEAPLGLPCLWSAAAGLGYAGDGCLGGRVEAAFLSGKALAAAVLSEEG